MALRDKLNSLAATATSKANSAIETGKLSLKISNEERKITEFTLNIGELMLDKLDAGETFDDEIMALYLSIQAAREVIAGARADMEAHRQAEEAGEADFTVSPVCTNCGADLPEGAKYCANCGTKAEVSPTCTSCGAELTENANFCTQCGTQAEDEKPAE